jgi:hypothetical protein
VGLGFLPGLVRADFIRWSYTTRPEGPPLDVHTDLVPLPPGDFGNPSGLGYVILSGVTGSNQTTNPNTFVTVPFLSNVAFQIDDLGNGDFQPTTGTILVDVIITDLASGKSGTFYIPFDVGWYIYPFAGVQYSPELVAGLTMRLGGNQYFIAPDIYRWDAFVEITPVSTPSPEPSALILGILGALPLGVVVGVSYFGRASTVWNRSVGDTFGTSVSN